MGYTTTFTGKMTITPPLNKHEVAYLVQLCESRRMERSRGPYFVCGSGFMGQDDEYIDQDIVARNDPDPSQPSLWCHWMPSADGKSIGWSGDEKFYEAPAWMCYLMEHFLAPWAILRKQLLDSHGEPLQGAARLARAAELGDERLAHFTFQHDCTGRIKARGEDPRDRWTLVVAENTVSVAENTVSVAENTVSVVEATEHAYEENGIVRIQESYR